MGRRRPTSGTAADAAAATALGPKAVTENDGRHSRQTDGLYGLCPSNNAASSRRVAEPFSVAMHAGGEEKPGVEPRGVDREPFDGGSDAEKGHGPVAFGRAVGRIGERSFSVF
jgi:hypothetical protein